MDRLTLSLVSLILSLSPELSFHSLSHVNFPEKLNVIFFLVVTNIHCKLPVSQFPQGKTCSHYRGTLFSLQGPCFHYRDFPVFPCTYLYFPVKDCSAPPRIFQLFVKGKIRVVYCSPFYGFRNFLYPRLLEFGAVCIRRMLLHIIIMLLCCTLADLQKQIVAKKRGHLSYI